MPSKSKKQARFFAAAAHDPEFAKSAGISTSAAKEWNQADKKAGTLKKSSNKPEKVTEELIDEANDGVGIIKVPPTLLKQCQKYIASVLLTLGYRQYQEDVKNYDDENSANILKGLKLFQRKYNASVLSAKDLTKYVNSLIRLKIDKSSLLSELPERLQNNPKVKDSIQKMELNLIITSQRTDVNGSYEQGANVSSITVAIPRSIPQTADDIDTLLFGRMNTVEHELQHAIQRNVISAANPKSNQLQRKTEYEDNDDEYYSSGIEYGPQVKDLINLTKDTMQRSTSELTGNMKEDITWAFNNVIKNHYKMKLVQALRNTKEDAAANKALKLIYKGLVDFYENELDFNEDETEFDSTEKPIDAGEDTYNGRHLKRPIAGETVMGDLYLAISQYFDEDPQAFGTFEDLSKIVVKRPFGTIELEKGMMGIHLYVYTGDKDTSYHIELNPTVSRALVKDVAYFTSVSTTQKLKEKLEDILKPDLSLDDAYYIMDRENGNSEIFSDSDSKGINLELIEEDSTIFFSLKGIRSSENNYLQIYNKSTYILGFAGGNDHFINDKDFKKVIPEIWDFYYQHSLEEVEQFINLLDISSKITPSTVEDAMEKSKKEVQEHVQESSMRTWMDVIQRADIDKNIDDAHNQTDVNRDHPDELKLIGEEDEEYDLQGKPVKPGQAQAPVHAGTSSERDIPLKEMPQRFDAIQGQDPDEFVDKTAEMSNKSKLKPFTQHENFDVMQSPNGSGFIALDKKGNQIAIVSGYVQGNIFREEAIASKKEYRGVVYQMFMDIIASGLSILSDTLHSDSAISFWKKLILKHNVYVVYDGEILAKATPDKFHKYWNDDENSPSADLRLLLRK